MDFASYHKQAWNDHATDSKKVATTFSNGLALVETNEQLAQFVGLVTHVMGEHLGEWSEGTALLTKLKDHKSFVKGSETENAIHRSIAALQMGAGATQDLQSFSLSDQIRIYAVAASALSEQNASRAEELLRKALSMAEAGLDSKDPANRALAVTGNVTASALERKTSRSEAEKNLMILAAQTGRKYWQIAGTWLEVERAEYRLAMSYLHADELTKALRHAQMCLEICEQNKAPELEMFFGYEALALIEKKRSNDLGFQKALEQTKSYFEKLSAQDKTWCESVLKNLI